MGKVRIAAAAIRKGDMVYTAKRHDLVFRAHGKISNGEQGFVTDDGRFVDRATAAVIAFESGQIPEPVTRLMSEDLIEYDPDYYCLACGVSL